MEQGHYHLMIMTASSVFIECISTVDSNDDLSFCSLLCKLLKSKKLVDRLRLNPEVTQKKKKTQGLGVDSSRLRCQAYEPLTERLLHMAQKIGNTSGVSKSLSDLLDSTGFQGYLFVC